VLTAVVNYKSDRQLQECIACLRRQTYAKNRIVVIDNSLDDTVSKQLDRSVQYIKNDGNPGYAFAVNQAFALAALDDYVLILNPDVTFGDNLIAELVEAAERHPDVGAVGPKVIETIRKNVSDTRVSDKRYDYVNWIIGCAMLFRLSAVRDVGSFDTAYFLYFEETDYFYRMRNTKWKALVVNSAKLYHHGGASTNTMPTRSCYYHVRNMFLFVRKNVLAKGWRPAFRAVMWHLRRMFYFPMHPLRMCAYLMGILVGVLILTGLLPSPRGGGRRPARKRFIGLGSSRHPSLRNPPPPMPRSNRH
jgi:GT2 family glycosyltransferase